jgi:uncharacterized protein (TIGR04255 family)
MEFTRHKVAEAICAFRFDPNQNVWGKKFNDDFFEKIKDTGFTIREEIQPVQVSVELKPDSMQARHQRAEPQTVFKNEAQHYAILMSKDYVSFHTLNGYWGWGNSCLN